MRVAKPIVPERIRNIRGATFGWVDHNFLHHGFLESLSQQELLLYYFLITVANRHGISFYDYERICHLLKMETDDYLRARDRLCERALVACQDGIFQVLSLPEPGDRHRATDSRSVKKEPDRKKPTPAARTPKTATGRAEVLRDILKMLDQ
jgi:hypothetical protein